MVRPTAQGWAWTLVAAWMVLIFLLSGQPADDSAALSGAGLRIIEAVVDPLARTVGGGGLSAETLAALHRPFRKAAHLLAYLTLGWLTARATHTADRVARPGLVAWLIATGYAATDEVHQRFVPGRSAELTDVLLDATGALVGVGLYWLASGHDTHSVRHRNQPQRLDRG